MYAFDNSIIVYETNSGYVGLVDHNTDRFRQEFEKHINSNKSVRDDYSRSMNINSHHSSPTILANEMEDVIGNKFKLFKWITVPNQNSNNSIIYLVAESQSVVKRYIKNYSEDNEIGTITELGRVKCYGRNRNGFYI
jgi:hypothetical protein